MALWDKCQFLCGSARKHCFASVGMRGQFALHILSVGMCNLCFTLIICGNVWELLVYTYCITSYGNAGSYYFTVIICGNVGLLFYTYLVVLFVQNYLVNRVISRLITVPRTSYLSTCMQVLDASRQLTFTYYI